MLGAEHDAPQIDGHDALVLVEVDFGQRPRARDARDVQHGVDVPEGVERCREHRLDVGFCRDVGVERHDGVAELGGGVLLVAADVGGQHLRPFPHEHSGRRPGHARPGTGDDRDLAVQFSHELSLSASGDGLDGRELQVELRQAPDDPGLLVTEPSVARGAVVLLGEPDVAHPVEDALEADATFGAGQRATGAGVGAAAERHVVQGVGPIDSEVVGALEPAGITVGAPPGHCIARARGPGGRGAPAASHRPLASL